jgi:outer membrane protein OmpA-like peptidoglycan-associated protein
MSQNVSRLKELLFDRENATLAELQGRVAQVAASEKASREELTQALQASVAAEAASRVALARRVEGLFDRAGTEERFRSSVATVLDGALREAEVTRHEQMSRAMAPLVVKTIKTELRNSQDEMVEALYPITGRLVKAYIASAMKDLTDQINRKLSGGSNPLMLRLRSLMTGHSVADLALAETQQLEVVELFLIRRGSGELLQHWPQGAQNAGVPSNMDIHLSGVLTAINDFAAQALKDGGGNLRTFELDEFRMYLRSSSTCLLAAKCRGGAPAGVEAILDDEFVRLIERNQKALMGDPGQLPGGLLAPLAQSLEQRLSETQKAIAAEVGLGFNPLKAIAVVISLPLLLFAGWNLYTRYETSRVRDVALQTIGSSAQLAGYPTQLDVSPRGNDVTITGLVPTSSSKADVIARLRSALPSSKVNDRLTVLPNQTAEFEPQLTSVKRDLAGFEGEVLRASVRRAMARAGRRLEQTLPELNRLDLALTDAGTRTTTRTVKANIERSLADLKKLQARIGGNIDMSQLAALSLPMHGISEQLKSASADLAMLLNRGSMGPAAPHADAAPNDVAESAEELGVAAEQLAATAVAVSQSAGIKPAPVAAPAIVQPTARERLEKWVKANAVFFAEGNEFRNAQVAQSTIDAAAKLIRESGAFVRIVGFTDERGGQSRNAPLAQTRAQRVFDALVEKGVPRQSMIAIGRPLGIDISPNVGAQSPNRRVEFEIGFEGEAAE